MFNDVVKTDAVQTDAVQTMSEQELKTEILNTRKGGFGSSDAKMLATVGRTGVIHAKAKERIAEMLGLEEPQEFSNIYTENGKKREKQIFDQFFNFNILAGYPSCQIRSNPYNEYATELYPFKLFNHIDVEVETPNKLTWYEIKTSKYDFEQTYTNYEEQLAWHWMILQQKAKEQNCLCSLHLVHYLEDYENLSSELVSERLMNVQCSLRLTPIIADIWKGFDIINNALPSFAENYKKQEVLRTDYLPVPMQKNVLHYQDLQKTIAEAEKEMATIRGGLLAEMEKYNVKKLETPLVNITYIAPTVRTSFDSKAFQVEHKELYEQFLEQTNVAASIKIIIKNS